MIVKNDDVANSLYNNLCSKQIFNPQMVSLFSRFANDGLDPAGALSYSLMIDEIALHKSRYLNNYLIYEGMEEIQPGSIVSVLCDYAMERTASSRSHEFICDQVSGDTGIPPHVVDIISTFLTDDSKQRNFTHDSIRQYLVARCLSDRLNDKLLDCRSISSMLDMNTHRFFTGCLLEKIQNAGEGADPLEVSVGPLIDLYEKVKRINAGGSDAEKIFGDKKSYPVTWTGEDAANGAILLYWIGRMAALDDRVKTWIKWYLSDLLSDKVAIPS